MSKDVDHILAQCETCEKFATSKAPSKSVIPLSDGKPYEQWAIDVIGPMPSNTTGCKFIITAVDFCTRWPVAQAIEHHDGSTVRRFIGKEIISKFGQPQRILTDCGREFLGKAMEDYFNNKSSKIEHHTTTPYHAQANGWVERLNGVLLDILKKLSVNDVSSWPKHLPTALMVARSLVNRDIGYSPFEMVYGLKPETVQSPQGLKLIEPRNVPKLDAVTENASPRP